MTGVDDDIALRRICYRCVGEPYLREQVGRGTRAACSYCGGKRRKTITVAELADEVEAAFERHYRRTSDQPHSWQYAMLSDRESDYEWERDGEPVIYAIGEAALVDEQAATDVQQVLEDRYADFESAQMGEECEFDSESYYEINDPSDVEFRFEWTEFERELKTEVRFFSRLAQGVLSSVFADLHAHQTHEGRSVIREAGPGTDMASIYRARVFQPQDNIEKALVRPDLEVGPPPSNAASPGRMNARGISVFYGALDADVALAEVRPPVGSRVAVARFNVVRPLRLLDLDALHSIYVEGSIFDPDYLRRLELAKFLTGLSLRVTAPVMPSDDPQDYLITQAIADYLANEAHPPVDGMIYPSAQNGNGLLNVVLFHKAARVAPMEIPEGTKIHAHEYETDEDGQTPDYFVWEERPARTRRRHTASNRGILFVTEIMSPSSQDPDRRVSALRIDPTSLCIHHVTGLTYATDPHPVSRRIVKKSTGRILKRKPEEELDDPLF
ncbi:MAG: RES domain-containing protein [Rhodospirillales bacterium]|nr:RES domain-containing protein [Rhodospirillales bacterium]